MALIDRHIDGGPCSVGSSSGTRNRARRVLGTGEGSSGSGQRSGCNHGPLVANRCNGACIFRPCGDQHVSYGER